MENILMSCFTVHHLHGCLTLEKCLLSKAVNLDSHTFYMAVGCHVNEPSIMWILIWLSEVVFGEWMFPWPCCIALCECIFCCMLWIARLCIAVSLVSPLTNCNPHPWGTNGPESGHSLHEIVPTTALFCILSNTGQHQVIWVTMKMPFLLFISFSPAGHGCVS